MPEQPENIVLQLLRELRADVARNAERTATKDDIAGLDQKIDVLRADVASDLANLEKGLVDQEKRLGDQIAHLRRAVML